MDNLLFVVQLNACPPEFRTLEDLTETLRCISLPNWQGGPDDFRVWRWTDGRTPEEITLRKARGSELPNPERFAGATWWWVAEGVRREPYAAVPAIDGALEERLLQAFRQASDDFIDFRAEGLVEIAMRALAIDAQAPLADLIKATDDDESSFEVCTVCGSGDVTYRGIYVSDQAAPSRTAWCAAAECEDDRRRTVVQAVPVARTETGYRIAGTWE